LIGLYNLPISLNLAVVHYLSILLNIFELSRDESAEFAAGGEGGEPQAAGAIVQEDPRAAGLQSGHHQEAT
jgi:hypothetical protein